MMTRLGFVVGTLALIGGIAYVPALVMVFIPMGIMLAVMGAFAWSVASLFDAE